MALFLNKVKDKVKKPALPLPFTYSPPQCPANTDSQIASPTPPDVYRYRYNHGVNLGSVFVLEKWLFGSMFPKCNDTQSSELEALKALVKEKGEKGAREKFENHWRNAVTQQDWDWLTGQAKCTAIRLPIGYFTLGRAFTKGTPFDKFATVYQNAWAIVKEFIQTAAAHRIGVLIDMHALPGGANTSDHSGTNSRKAELWSSQSHRDLASKCINYVVQDIRTSNLTNVIGVQACNEADSNAHDLWGYYDKILATMEPIDKDMPLYVSDGWTLGQAIPWALSRNSKTTISNPVFLDSHYYWAFSDADKAKTPDQIISDVKNKMYELDGQEGSIHDRGAVQVAVGEYSCVMAGEVWQAHPMNREALVKQFGQEQTRRYQERAAGAFFWTLKMDWNPGGEWGFVEQTNKQALPAPSYLRIPHSRIPELLRVARAQKEWLKNSAVSAHASHWDSTYPDGKFEHWRYEPGWLAGWSDAEAFFVSKLAVNTGNSDGTLDLGIIDKIVDGAQKGVQDLTEMLGFGSVERSRLKGQRCDEGVDRIGAKELWTLKRVRESGQAYSEFCWEWEAGLRKGIEDFEGIVGIREAPAGQAS